MNGCIERGEIVASVWLFGYCSCENCCQTEFAYCERWTLRISLLVFEISFVLKRKKKCKFDFNLVKVFSYVIEYMILGVFNGDFCFISEIYLLYDCLLIIIFML